MERSEEVVCLGKTDGDERKSYLRGEEAEEHAATLKLTWRNKYAEITFKI